MRPLFVELQRRKVYRAAAFYAAAAWLLVQIATQVFPFFDIPPIWVRVIVVVCVLGFPVALGFAWFYEWTPKGFRREIDAERSEDIARIVSQALDRRGMMAHSLSLPNVPSSFEQSIAVLPFADLSEGRDQQYFSDGFADDLLNLLVLLPQLRVVARTSSFGFRDSQTDLAKMAAELKVATVLSGSVRRDGNTLQVAVLLTRAADGSKLWAQAFDNELGDVFSLQDTIARAVIAAMRVKLLRSQRLKNPHRTEKIEAYGQFLLGQSLIRRGSDIGNDALQAFEKAIALDPEYAPAHAGLAEAQSAAADLSANAAQRDAGKQQALATAEKAIALGPDLADGYLIRGRIRYRHLWDWKGAEADFQQALMRDPSNSDLLTVYSQGLLNVGRNDEAFVLIGRATEFDPLSSQAWALYGAILSQLGSAEEARTAIERAVAISPDSKFARSALASLDLEQGRFEAALENFRQADAGQREAGIAMAEHSLGHAAESRAALTELQHGHSAGSALPIARACAWRGEKDAAFEWLERAFARHDPGLLGLRADPQFGALKSDRRFATLLRKLNFPD